MICIQENILYSVKYDNPILIDFGLSIPIDRLNLNDLKDLKDLNDLNDLNDLKEYFYIYSPDYAYLAHLRFMQLIF